MNAHLDRDIRWKGVLYKAGDREIPDDLAIALGLGEQSPDEQSSADEPTEPLPPPPAPAPKLTKRQKREL